MSNVQKNRKIKFKKSERDIIYIKIEYTYI